MGKDDLSKKIKDRLADHEEFINKDELWTSLGIKEEKKRKPFVWWFTGAGILMIFLLIIGYGLFFNSNESHIANNTNQNSTETIENLELSSIVNEDKLSSITKTPLENKTKSEEIEKSNSQTVQFKNRDKNKKTTSSNSTKSSNQLVLLKKEVGKPIINEKKIPLEVDAENRQIDHENLGREEQKETKNQGNEDQNILIAERLNPLLLQVSSTNDENLNIVLEREAFVRPIQKQKPYLSWYAFGAAGLYQRSFELQNQELADFHAERNQKEQTLESIAFGIGLKYNITPSVYAKVGVDYTRHTESYAYETVERKEVFDTLYQNISLDYKGDTTFTNPGLVFGFQDTKDKFKFFNMIHTLNIPILVGYQYKWNKWGAFVEAGPVINAALIYRGQGLDPRGQLVKNPDNIYKSNIGVGLEGSLGLNYQITPLMKIWASPSIRYMPSSITNASYGINQRISSWNMRVGIERRF